MDLPDDAARLVLDAAQASGRTILSVLIGQAQAVPAYCIEVVKTRTTRALACVCRQMARLSRLVLRDICHRTYRNAIGLEPERVVFLETRNR